MNRLFRTADGTNTGAFGPGDWALLVLISTIWGSSFLWISIALETASAATVAFVRVLFGAFALSLFPGARRNIERGEWSGIVVVAIAGNAAPGLFIALAQQRIESSVAGMINAAAPLATLLVTVAMVRRSPGGRQVVGLLIGFGGVAAMAWPSLSGADAEPLGVVLMLVAVTGYGISNNVIIPLQQRYGGPAVVLRALLISAAVLAPWGLWDLAASRPSPRSWTALVILGVLGTGAARALHATLGGRIGASRSALVTYFVPIIAIALGVGFLDEQVEGIELAGVVLVLFGAYLTSRRQRAPTERAGG